MKSIGGKAQWKEVSSQPALKGTTPSFLCSPVTKKWTGFSLPCASTMMHHGLWNWQPKETFKLIFLRYFDTVREIWHIDLYNPVPTYLFNFIQYLLYCTPVQFKSLWIHSHIILLHDLFLLTFVCKYSISLHPSMFPYLVNNLQNSCHFFPEAFLVL